jgi:acyl-CoA thioesterase I
MKALIIIIILGILISVGLFFFRKNNMSDDQSKILYVAIGDSYTIGQGVSEDQSWPVLLTKHLNESGVPTELVANPSRTGWTTQEVLDYELRTVELVKPDFVSLLIGVNDWVQEVDADIFRQRLGTIMDRVVSVLAQKDHLLIVTIPDYAATPTGSQFGDPQTNSKGIEQFNQIIKDEAGKRGLSVVDIFELSQGVKEDRSLVAPDGLHPSGKEYQRWEEIIYPAVASLLRK